MILFRRPDGPNLLYLFAGDTPPVKDNGLYLDEEGRGHLYSGLDEQFELLGFPIPRDCGSWIRFEAHETGRGEV